MAVHEIEQTAPPPTDGRQILVWGPHMDGWLLWRTAPDANPAHVMTGATHWSDLPQVPEIKRDKCTCCNGTGTVPRRP